MNLPETTMLNFFNKVLLSLIDLSPNGDLCTKESLIKQCEAIALGGERGDYELILDHCKFCGFIQLKNNHVNISILGQKFLDANRGRYFEINEAQKAIIAERIIFKGAWAHHARSLFDNFYLNQTSAAYECSLESNPLSNSLMAILHFFKYVGILAEDKSIVSVNKKYDELVYLLTADRKTITEQQLEKILMENRKLGVQAEEAVVEFERKRLLKLGKPVQAALVKRVSPIDAGAGYDIESFDGSNDEIFPDRFIEVKATTGDEIRFYWTHNERKVAARKRDNYWIYMMLAFRQDKPSECIPIMIQNPDFCIPKQACLTMETHIFLIKEISEVGLTQKSIEEVKWYQLP